MISEFAEPALLIKIDENDDPKTQDCDTMRKCRINTLSQCLSAQF
jgi:hypothetical protein